jgi:FKBP-type peptidyl-prolyl cis-trans isomerase 2
MTQQADMGDRVAIEYIATLDNGHIFDETEGTPRTITLGAEQIFPALEEELVGMVAGDVKNVELNSDQAYGPRLQDNMLQVERSLFPAERELTLGEKLSITLADGSDQTMRIRSIDAETVLLDGNHDLAGRHLTFAIKLVSIEKKGH